MPETLHINLATPDEIRLELGRRLKQARLQQRLMQSEVADRAEVSRGAVASLENRGQSTLDTLVRVVQALGPTDGLDGLFLKRPQSIAAMERDALAPPRRIRKSGARPK